MTDWLKPGNGAVITGGASGIGLAAAKRFARLGMKVLIADRDEAALEAAADSLSEIPDAAIYTQICDVADFEALQALQQTAAANLGAVHCLMNNAGAGLRAGAPWENLEEWRKQLEINLWGIIHGCQAFIPAMLESDQPGVVINTGSKQGITNPPGNYAYNLSKAGVKAYTESLAHAFRQMDDCRLQAHLLIPGFTYTGMIARFIDEQPPGAWSPEQLVDFMFESLDRGDFYILCPDNETPRALDEKRIQWNTDDLIENRSALSRWDPEYAAQFEAFIAKD
jgi:NAD(P)-dependent dehydrogenase (short-subunit alcohol dehydrogenase family)